MSKIGKIVKRDNSTFYWSCMYLFPKAKREAIYAVYAFCKHLDGVVDGSLPMEEKLSLIQAWKEELHNIYDNKVPSTEVGRYIYKNCMRFKLPKERFINLLEQISVDLPNPVQSMPLESFNEYCNAIAGTPCYFTMKIMGFDNELSEKLAQNLGLFLQITDILLDVKDDAKMNRLYVPSEFVNKAKITASDPEHIVTDKNFSLVRKELGLIAEDNLQKAHKIIDKMDKKSALPFKILLNVYEQYFYAMKTRGWEIISPKPILTNSKKWAIILKSVMK